MGFWEDFAAGFSPHAEGIGSSLGRRIRHRGRFEQSLDEIEEQRQFERDARRKVEKLVSHPAWNRLSDEKKQEKIHDAFTWGRERARGEMKRTLMRRIPRHILTGRRPSRPKSGTAPHPSLSNRQPRPPNRLMR